MPPTVRFADRLLAETFSMWERIEPEAAADPTAELLAQQAEGELERKIIVRAQVAQAASDLKHALRQVRSAVGLIIFAGVILGGVAGAAAARAALGMPGGEPVNFYLLLLTLLGVQVVMLLLWLTLMVLSGRGSAGLGAGTLGGLVAKLAQFIARLTHKGPKHAAAVSAFASVHFRDRIGRWALSSISHTIWAAFNVGALSAVVVLLSAKQYLFVWETTILSERTYVPLTLAIAAAPKAMGFDAPTREQIIDSKWTGDAALDRRDRIAGVSTAWSSLLVGCIVIYGFGPRLLLLGLSLGMRRKAARDYRLDLNRPEYLRLGAILQPPATTTVKSQQVIEMPAAPRAARRAVEPRRAPGPPAIVGIEIRPPTGATWPPPAHGVQWMDLGFVDTRHDRARVLEQLERSDFEPQTVIAVCSLTTTPDRGVGSFLAQLQSSVAQPITLVLSGGQSLRLRGREDNGNQNAADSSGTMLDHRIEDWRSLAKSLSIDEDRVIELDLDHFTQASSAKLAAIIDRSLPSANRSDEARLATALNLINQQAAPWFGRNKAPTHAEQIELHRKIAGLYRGEASRWLSSLSNAGVLSTNFAANLTTGSQLTQVSQQLQAAGSALAQRLPLALRSSPKWLAAGAAAGAFGCIAAATMISPVAIAALPMWSAIGAALATVLSASIAGAGSATSAAAIDEASATQSEAIGQAVRAAALFTVLLDLQGRDEAGISRGLEQVFADQQAVELQSQQQVQDWLERIRQRAQAAVTQEAR